VHCRRSRLRLFWLNVIFYDRCLSVVRHRHYSLRRRFTRPNYVTNWSTWDCSVPTTYSQRTSSAAMVRHTTGRQSTPTSTMFQTRWTVTSSRRRLLQQPRQWESYRGLEARDTRASTGDISTACCLWIFKWFPSYTWPTAKNSHVTVMTIPLRTTWRVVELCELWS
jgi:hypothetical protein